MGYTFALYFRLLTMGTMQYTMNPQFLYVLRSLGLQHAGILPPLRSMTNPTHHFCLSCSDWYSEDETRLFFWHSREWLYISQHWDRYAAQSKCKAYSQQQIFVTAARWLYCNLWWPDTKPWSTIEFLKTLKSKSKSRQSRSIYKITINVFRCGQSQNGVKGF